MIRCTRAAAILLALCSAANVPAQDVTAPLSGVWLLAFKGTPLAMLMAFDRDTYRVLGRVTSRNSEISWVTLDEDGAPRPYALEDLAIDGGAMTFGVTLEGMAFQAMGPAPGSTLQQIPIFLFTGGSIAAQLVPMKGVQAVAADGSRPAPFQTPPGAQPQATPARATPDDGWTRTDKGSFHVERFWEETAGSYTATYTIVSYKNTTERTFASSVRIKATIYDRDDRMIDSNTRSFFASEYGAMGPGFTGEVKIPVDATAGSAKSVRVMIEIAN